jgi:hypothetical protein
MSRKLIESRVRDDRRVGRSRSALRIVADTRTTTGGGVDRVDLYVAGGLLAGSPAAQPGAATRLRRTRRRLVASTVVVSPLISGVFFGLVAALLTLRSGSGIQAIEFGGLVGGVMFASNAVALCFVSSAARDGLRPRAGS